MPKRELLELGAASANAALELQSLERQRQSLGPLTIKPAAAPPPLPRSKLTAEDAKKSAMAKALAAARAADAAYGSATRPEIAKEADLRQMSDIAVRLEKGDASAAGLLTQMFLSEKCEV